MWSRRLKLVLFKLLVAVSVVSLASCEEKKSPDETAPVESITLSSLLEYEEKSTVISIEDFGKLSGEEVETDIKEFNAQTKSIPQDNGFIIANGRSTTSTPFRGIRIVDGIKTAAYPTTGALLIGPNRDEASLQCTGTLISCNSFLTAAHCLTDVRVNAETGENEEYQNTNPDGYFVYFQHAGMFEAIEVSYIQDEYSFPDADVALITLDRSADGLFTYPINDRTRVPKGTVGEIVGFGRTGGFNNRYGIKRYGKVESGDCAEDLDADNFVCWEFNRIIDIPVGENSNTCNGDSGGPLFTSHVGDTSKILSGVTSGGKNANCLSGDQSYDASVFEYSDWITQNSAGDLGDNSCGIAPHIGDAEVSVLASDGSLDVGGEQVFDFQVPTNASKLVVAMNGEIGSEHQGIDFNLSVELGKQPEIGNSTCDQNGVGQFAACEIENPNAGTWYASVNQVKGSGQYQIVVTIYQ